MNYWTKIDQMLFESDLKDSIYAVAASEQTEPRYSDMEGEIDFYEYYSPLF